MSTPTIEATDIILLQNPATVALGHLKDGANPFTYTVVTAGSEEQCEAYDVPEIHDSQISDLRNIVGLYRDGRPTSRVYPILGDPGSGKTHLMTRFANELMRDAVEAGRESVVLTAGHIPPINGVDYLYRLLVSHMLEHKGAGARTRTAVAARVSARLLGEALRRLAPPKQIQLIPAKNMWDGIALKLGRSKATESRFEAIARIVEVCADAHPTREQILQACDAAGISFGSAKSLAIEHLNRTERANDARGWVRRQLYSRLVELFFDENPDRFDELFIGEIPDIPGFLSNLPKSQASANPKDPDDSARRSIDIWLLRVWLELFDEFAIPVVLILDQIENETRRANAEVELAAIKAFGLVLSSIVNNVDDVCILLFSTRAVWYAQITEIDKHVADRLQQQFSLPGQPSKDAILMPLKVTRSTIEKIIRQRIRKAAPDANFTGLPQHFPFSDSDFAKLDNSTSVRECLRALGKRYNEIVYGDFDKDALKTKLNDHWLNAIKSTKKEFGDDAIYTAAKIPDVQIAIDGWLQVLKNEGLTGTANWHGVELLNVLSRSQYGYLNVIRTDGRDAPGIGIAAWLAEGSAKSNDLKKRLEFFDDNPCAIRTIVLFRRDGNDAVNASTTKKIFDDAVKNGKDVRIQKFEPKHVHSLMALDRWRQSIAPEVDQFGDEGRRLYREKLTEISTDLVRWIESWCQPAKGQAT